MPLLVSKPEWEKLSFYQNSRSLSRPPLVDEINCKDNEFRCKCPNLKVKTGTRSSNRNIQKKTREKDPDVEEALDKWFSILSGKGVNINGPILKAKSEELDKKRRRNDFKATDNGSLCHTYISLFGYNKAMERITVLCCTNMSGTDKRKLLIIGKSARPRCFKGPRMEGLPVEYHANKKAWMTSEIFRNWLTNTKILLIVDNCAAHPHLDNLQHIQLEFLPPNTTSLVQLMYMGVIKNFNFVSWKIG
ncbi:hypothetical protein RF11_04829 [Thelohanellus kitauei]|uniref:Uncharacterized protein n=1 Tax=Thelohanellus kitauei TaxID=669202 RepID=A0A0C2ME64_THEKT|nr:hypothetical protein RF11_04829 [Thelohanellus kitauei]